MEFVDRLYFLMRIIRVQTHTGHFVFLQNIYLLDLLVGQLEPLFYLIPFIDNSRHFNFFYFGPLHKTKLRFRTKLLLFWIIDEILKHYGVFLELFVQRLLGQNFGHRVDVITVLLLFWEPQLALQRPLRRVVLRDNGRLSPAHTYPLLISEKYLRFFRSFSIQIGVVVDQTIRRKLISEQVLVTDISSL